MTVPYFGEPGSVWPAGEPMVEDTYMMRRREDLRI